MCVIAIAETDRPTDDMIEKMYAQNDQGAGIAWREDGYVKWEKGLDLEAVKKLCKEVPMPYIAHFRIASYGGKRESLCHPFPIDKKVPLNLKGRTKGHVLFHNGHWAKWRETMLDTVVASNTPVPSGKWSDTRAMAFTASVYGIGVLELIDEKAVAFGPETCDLSGSGWAIVDKIWVSNRFWEHRTVHHGMGHNYYEGNNLCKMGTCNAHKYAETDYCYQHRHMINEDKEELPVINIKKEGDDKDKSIITLAEVVANSKRASGGKLNLLPFAEIERRFKAGHMSNNQFKKARKRYQKEQKSMRKHLEKFHLETMPPMTIVH